MLGTYLNKLERKIQFNGDIQTKISLLEHLKNIPTTITDFLKIKKCTYSTIILTSEGTETTPGENDYKFHVFLFSFSFSCCCFPIHNWSFESNVFECVFSVKFL